MHDRQTRRLMHRHTSKAPRTCTSTPFRHIDDDVRGTSGFAFYLSRTEQTKFSTVHAQLEPNRCHSASARMSSKREARLMSGRNACKFNLTITFSIILRHYRLLFDSATQAIVVSCSIAIILSAYHSPSGQREGRASLRLTNRASAETSFSIFFCSASRSVLHFRTCSPWLSLL